MMRFVKYIGRVNEIWICNGVGIRLLNRNRLVIDMRIGMQI